MTDLYPEVDRAGSIANAAQEALGRRGSRLVVSPNDGVEVGDRSAGVSLAALERSFHSEFWDRGVLYGSQAAESLDEIISGWCLFVEDACTVEELERRLPGFVANPNGRAHQAGRLVLYRWEVLLFEPTQNFIHAQMRPLIEAASRAPALRRLLPYLSHWTLHFSRVTGYPYSLDCPGIEPADQGLYRVTGPLVTDPVFVGTAVEAVAATIARLPPGCGPAIDGTADWLRKRDGAA